MVTKSRFPIADEEKIQMAKARFTVTDGRFASYGEVAEKFGRNPENVARWIVEVFERGLVGVDRLDSPFVEPPRRVDWLERELKRIFRIDCVIVIEDAVSARPKVSTKELGDRLHAKLGQAMANVIAEGHVLRDGDVIGIGSGRGVYYTVDALRQLPPLLNTDVTLLSLTGAAYPRDHSEQLNLFLDSDVNLLYLALCFQAPVNFWPISNPIAFADERALRAAMMVSAIGENWQQPSRIITFLGIGVLGPGHRFWEQIRSPRQPGPRRGYGPAPDVLAPLNDLLRPLVTLCERVGLSGDKPYCPVADLCHRLYYVPPPPGVEVAERDRAKINELLAAINAKLFTVRQEQLQDDRVEIHLIAGTLQKAWAIRELIRNSPYKPRVLGLCTDAEAAKAMLAWEYS